MNYYNLQGFSGLSFYKQGISSEGLGLFLSGAAVFLGEFVFVNGNQHVTGLNRPNDRKKSESWAGGLLSLLCPPLPPAFPERL